MWSIIILIILSLALGIGAWLYFIWAVKSGQYDDGRATMTCIVENVFEDGEWAILEWRDPNGLRGCGFFHVRNDQIIFQRGYFDQLSFFRRQGLEVPESYLGA